MNKENLNIENETYSQGLVEVGDSDPIRQELTVRQLLLKNYRLFKDRLRGAYFAEAPDGQVYDVGQEIKGRKPIFWNLSKFNFSKAM